MKNIPYCIIKLYRLKIKVSYFTKVNCEICIKFICTKCEENVKIQCGILFKKLQKIKSEGNDMKKNMKKVVAGSLVCVMAATAAPFVQVTPSTSISAYAMAPVELEVEWYGEYLDSSRGMCLYLGTPHAVNVSLRGDSEAKFTYTSSDPSIFTVDENGVLTPHNKEGEATLTIEADSKFGKKMITKTVFTQLWSYCGNMAYEVFDDGQTYGFLSASYDDASITRVCIPRSINGRTCSVVGRRSCSGYTNLVSIEVPEGAKTILDYAFADTPSLEWVFIPESVTEIADNTFGDKALAKKVVLRGYAGSEAEKFAKAHEDQVIFEAIAPEAFEVEWYGEKMDSLRGLCLYLDTPHAVNVSLPEDRDAKFTYTSSDPSVFTVDEKGVLTAVSKGEATLTIEADSKSGRKVITKNVFTQPYSYCGDMAYEILDDGESFRFLQASYDSKEIKRACIPYNISGRTCLIVGERSCSGYNNVIYFEVPEGVKTIEDYAFADNASLEMVMIPKSVTKIADNIFGDKALEKKVVLKGYAGSEAEKFAKAHEDQVIFEAIEGDYVYYRYIYQFNVENSQGTKNSMNLEVGEEAQLFIKTEPEVVDEKYSIEVEDDSIVSVTSQGAITAKKSGYTAINIVGQTGAKSVQYVTVKDKEVEPTATPVYAIETPVCSTITPEVTTSVAVTATPEPTHVCTSKQPTQTPTCPTITPEMATPVPTMTETPYPTPVCVTKQPTQTPEVTTSSAVTGTPDVVSSPAVTGTAVSDQGIAPLDKENQASAKGFDDVKEEKKTSKKAKVNISTSKKKKFKVGKKYTIKAKKYNTESNLKWSVSNKKIATIDSKTGILKAKKAGKVTITVTCGKVKDKITIRIKK